MHRSRRPRTRVLRCPRLAGVPFRAASAPATSSCVPSSLSGSPGVPTVTATTARICVSPVLACRRCRSPSSPPRGGSASLSVLLCTPQSLAFCLILCSWVRRRRHPPAAGAAQPTLQVSASSSSSPLPAAMGLLSLRPGGNPCSACPSWQWRCPRVPFSFLEALLWPSVVPLLELRGNPRSGFSRPDGDSVSALSSFLKALSCSLVVPL